MGRWRQNSGSGSALATGRNKQAWHGEGPRTEAAVKKQRFMAQVWATPLIDLFNATWQLPAYMGLRGMSSRQHRAQTHVWEAVL